MRKEFSAILKSYFCQQVWATRTACDMTQAAMAERLMMADRSYIDLDHGKISCSALTLALFLIYCCPDPEGFLAGLRQAFEEAENRVA